MRLEKGTRVLLSNPRVRGTALSRPRKGKVRVEFDQELQIAEVPSEMLLKFDIENLPLVGQAKTRKES